MFQYIDLNPSMKMKLQILSPNPLKNCSKALGLNQLVSTGIPIKAYKYHQNEPMQGRRYRKYMSS